MYGGVNLFADALGMTTKEFMKAMESGQLMSDEVLPKLAIQMKKVANTNGALAEAQQSVNAQQQRFLTQLTLTKKAMFEGGFGKSMADAFKIMADFMKDNKEGFSAIGSTIGGAIKAIVSALNIALQPIMLLVKAFNGMFGDAGAKVLGTVIAVTAMSKAVSAMAAAFALANLGFMTLVRNIAKYGLITTAVLGLEDLYVGTHGGRAVSSNLGIAQWFNDAANTKLGQIITSPIRTMRTIGAGNNPFALSVDVNVNDGEFAKAVDVKVRQASEDSIANTAAKLGG